MVLDSTAILTSPEYSRKGSPMTPPSTLIFALIIAFLLSPMTLHGDRIHLRAGGVITGKVISNGAEIVVRLESGGRVSFSRDQVEKIETSLTPLEELQNRERQLQEANPDSLAALGRWAQQQKLSSEAKRLAWKIIELDPDHSWARDYLRFKRLGAVWLTEEDFHHIHGRVREGQRWIPRKEWEELQKQRHRHDVLAQLDSDFKKAARFQENDSSRENALGQFTSAPEDQRWWVLSRKLRSSRSRERQLAARLAGGFTTIKPVTALAHLAIRDRVRSVRDEALRTLTTMEVPDLAIAFLPYLEGDNDRYRVNAARALNIFPDPRAVPVLMRSLHMIWAGFGRSHFAQMVQRSYVKDYELVSGGTGLVVSEVADPVIDVFLEGVVIDVKVRRAEATSRIAALQQITGESFGMDFEAWERWWQAERGGKDPATD